MDLFAKQGARGQQRRSVAGQPGPAGMPSANLINALLPGGGAAQQAPLPFMAMGMMPPPQQQFGFGSMMGAPQFGGFNAPFLPMQGGYRPPMPQSGFMGMGMPGFMQPRQQGFGFQPQSGFGFQQPPPIYQAPKPMYVPPPQNIQQPPQNNFVPNNQSTGFQQPPPQNRGFQAPPPQYTNQGFGFQAPPPPPPQPQQQNQGGFGFKQNSNGGFGF